MDNQRTILSVLLLAVISVCGGCSYLYSSETGVDASTAAAETDAGAAEALRQIDNSPASPLGYQRLAAVYMKRWRETGDWAYITKSHSAVDRGLGVAPGDQILRKFKASLHLSSHSFADALELGKQLEMELPNDQFVYGVLTDANAELGNYADAVESAQKMVDLKPNAMSYARVAHLRWLHGDHAGAVELYKMAARTTDPLDSEAQSWTLSQLGNEYWRNGKYTEAEKVYDEALSLLPDYNQALAGKGRVLASVGDLSAAAEYLTKANAKAPHTDTLILLGDIYAKLGNTAKAAKQYSLAEIENELFDAHRVALHWADININLEKALEVAQTDYDTQKDIYAADTLAWCLYKNGKLAEAKLIIREAMRLKTKDAKIIYHAGMIELATGNTHAAAKLLKYALKLNPSFDLVQSAVAKDALAGLDSARANKKV